MPPHNFPEDFLDFLYSSDYYIQPLTTDCGIEITFISKGEKNIYEGPDYANALITANGRIIKTDIELDINKHFWIIHGHSNNPNFSKTFLQIYFSKKKGRKTQKENSGLPMRINLYYQLIDDIEILHVKWIEFKTSVIRLCNIKKLENHFPVYRQILDWGKYNLELKIKKAGNLIRDYGLKKALVILIGRSLGYSANKEVFTKLCVNIDMIFLSENCYSLRKKNIFEFTRAYILHIAGIKKNNAFAGKLNELNLKFRVLRSRPANYYAGRLNLLTSMIAMIINSDVEELSGIITVNLDTEKNRNKFYKRLFSFADFNIGRQHGSIISANSLLPLITAFFRLEKDYFSASKYLEIIHNLPGCLINIKLRQMLNYTNLDNKIINSRFLYQIGLLYAADNFCCNFSEIKSGTNSETFPP